MTAQTPQPLIGPDAWTGTEMAAHGRWKFVLGDSDVAEIDAALSVTGEMPWYELTAADFPLPGFSQLLSRIAGELEHGSGLAKLTGLPVGRYAEEDPHPAIWSVCLCR